MRKRQKTNHKVTGTRQQQRGILTTQRISGSVQKHYHIRDAETQIITKTFLEQSIKSISRRYSARGDDVRNYGQKNKNLSI